MAQSVADYFATDKAKDIIKEIHELGINTVNLSQPVNTQNTPFTGKTFVITGTLPGYKRSEAAAIIEKLGGKVSGSVSKKTSYLVNNDVESTSSKNLKARELGIPILSEEDFIAQFGQG